MTYVPTDLRKIRDRVASGDAVNHTWGRGHDGLVNCVRTAMSKSASITKTCVAANAIYSHKFAGHDALASAFVATCEDSPVIFSLVGISRNRLNL